MKISSKTEYSKLEGWLAILVNTLLFALKYWAGIASGSIAIVADAWHTLSDSVSSIFVLIGAKVSSKPPDTRHPFGHGRAELITALIIGMFLAFIAYEFIRESIARLASGTQTNFGLLAIAATLLSIIAKEGLAQFAFWAARKTNYESLKADGWHHRTDALSSVLILVGILVGSEFKWLDGLLGILVALLILYSAYKVIHNAIDPLMGKTPDQDLINKVNSLCKKVCGHSIQAHHFHLHEYGDHSELTFHIVFPADYTLKQAHDLTTLIESELRQNFNIEATIHMEPKGDEKEFRPESQKTI
jgi:cation diffusion facilitator family transporter